jgi:hypothetical protein
MLKTKATPNASPTGGGYNSSPKDTNKVPNKQEKEARRSTKGIPLIPLDAVAGFPAAADNDGVYMEDCEHYSIPEFEAKGANFLIRVSGDSMMPLYNNGDIIACRKISSVWNKQKRMPTLSSASPKIHASSHSTSRSPTSAPSAPSSVLSDSSELPPFYHEAYPHVGCPPPEYTVFILNPHI